MPASSDTLLSPGAATTARAQGEASLLRQVRAEVRALLSRLSGAPWLGEVLTEWRVVVDHLAPNLPDEQARLLRSRVPETIHSAVTEGTADDTLADTLARTEATTVFNATQLAILGSEGYPTKRWVSHHDTITRPSHLQADGQTVPLSQPFRVGHELLQHPGDPLGSPAEVANCRCVIVGIGTPVPPPTVPTLAEVVAEYRNRRS